MSHEHLIYDTDKRFIIDSATRTIDVNKNNKPVLAQHDHNSEYVTFVMDRYVEGHDLAKCTRAEVHYNNFDIDERRASRGFYEAVDLRVDPSDEEKVIFTWIISDTATHFEGPLYFVVSFVCVEDDIIVYRWNTVSNSYFFVSSGICNLEFVEERYADVLEQWREDLFTLSGEEATNILVMAQKYLEAIEQKGENTLEKIPEEYTELDSIVKAYGSGEIVAGSAESLKHRFEYEVIAESIFYDDEKRIDGGYHAITSEFTVGNTYLVIAHGTNVAITHSTYVCGLLNNGSWESMIVKTDYNGCKYAVINPTENTDSICAMFSASEGLNPTSYVKYSIIDITNTDEPITDIVDNYVYPLTMSVEEISDNFNRLNENDNLLSFAWKDKKALVIGDSLTAAGIWQKELTNLLGMTIKTHALGGIGITQCVDGTNGIDPLMISDVYDKDLIVFFAGYNNRGTDDGVVGDCYNADEGTGQSIAGYLQYAINKIYELLNGGSENGVTYESNLGCRVIIVTPHCAGKYSYIDADGYDEYPTGSGRTMQTLAQIMEDVANYNNIPCYNAWKNSGINKFTWNEYASSSTPNSGETEQGTGGQYYWNADQLHLNEEKGYPHLGKCIAKFINSI